MALQPCSVGKIPRQVCPDRCAPCSSKPDPDTDRYPAAGLDPGLPHCVLEIKLAKRKKTGVWEGSDLTGFSVFSHCPVVAQDFVSKPCSACRSQQPNLPPSPSRQVLSKLTEISDSVGWTPEY